MDYPKKPEASSYPNPANFGRSHVVFVLDLAYV